jgi:hypothetical protein
VDLNKAIEKNTYAFVKKRFDAENGGDLFLDIKNVGNDGVIDLDASENIRFGDRRGDIEFAVNERVRLTDSPKGLRIEILKMCRLPNDH